MSDSEVARSLPGLLAEKETSLRQLAKNAGISVSYLSRVLAGAKPASGEEDVVNG